MKIQHYKYEFILVIDGINYFNLYKFHLINKELSNPNELIQNFKLQYNMDTTEAPQIIEHVAKSLTCTPFDVKWIPSSARFVLFG